MKVIRNAAVSFLEGNKTSGSSVAEEAVKLVVAKTAKYGIGLVGIRNLLPFSHPGTYAKQIAEQDFIGIVIIDGGRAKVAPSGSREPVIGTNPIAFGIPAVKGSWVVDMATSKHAWNIVRRALENNTKLPADVYQDRLGKFTTDPKKAFSVVPFGDYKGFALGLLVEILCGGLLNMEMGKTKKSDVPSKTLRGSMFIAIDIKQFVPIAKFKTSVTKLLREVKSAKRKARVRHIRLPGDSSLNI